MKKIVLALCDRDKSYISHFMEYAREKKITALEIQIFSDTEKLLKYEENHVIDILLVGEKLALELPETKDWLYMMLGEENHVQEIKGVPVIYKYQSCGQIINEILRIYGEKKEIRDSLPEKIKHQIEITGVYSPVGRNGKTEFSIAYAQILAQTNSVFYLNLEEYSGFPLLIGKSGEQDLSDLLYYIRKSSTCISTHIANMVQKIGDVDYILPPVYPADMSRIELEEWEQVIDAITGTGNYDALVIDFGGHIRGLYELLNKCHKIFVPIIRERTSEAKVAQFEHMLGVLGFEQILGSIRKIEVPKEESLSLEQISHGLVGKFAMEVLKGESL